MACRPISKCKPDTGECNPGKKLCRPESGICNPNPKAALPLKKVMNMSLKDIIDRLTGRA
jgi:hypothetical protein